VRAKRTTFSSLWLPALLLAPQLAITAVFFLWPAVQAIWSSVLREDAFGTKTQFVGLANFTRLFSDETYLASAGVTLVFSLTVGLLSLALGLLFAALADQVTRGRTLYRTLLVWPYALAPAVAAVLWFFMFNPTVGLGSGVLRSMGVDWNPQLNGRHALILTILAATWKQVSYNFLFFLAGLQAIPKSLIEAAAIDGARAFARFRRVILPLLMPTTFFLLVVNMLYAFIDTFGIIHATTGGGPGQATSTLVFRVYRDGFEGLDLGLSAAQSVVLLLVIGTLTLIQFRYIERRVEY
jgi:sn-glycerol 3-phosphate transport system permease protein